MLSAAAAALLTAAFASARADTTITTATSTELTTSTAGNIVIDATGSVNITKNGVAAVTLNSNNSVVNNGAISNAGTEGGVGVVIDTTSGNILNSTGFGSTGNIDVGGNGRRQQGSRSSGKHQTVLDQLSLL